MDNYKCERCNKSFSSLRALCGHKASCEKEKEECPICHRLIGRHVIKKHIETHNKDNYCLTCGERIPNTKKFCNHSCAASYNNKGVKRFFGAEQTGMCSDTLKPIKCKECHSTFMPIRKDNIFCSRECFVNHHFKKKDQEYQEGKIKNMATLKRHYLKNNEYKCAICGISKWNDAEIVLILDHIDGNPENNKPDNLRLVCPNCDSQLPTYKSKNIGNGRAYRRQRYVEGKSY